MQPSIAACSSAHAAGAMVASAIASDESFRKNFMMDLPGFAANTAQGKDRGPLRLEQGKSGGARDKP
jgi:hypothetical protein